MKTSKDFSIWDIMQIKSPSALALMFVFVWSFFICNLVLDNKIVKINPILLTKRKNNIVMFRNIHSLTKLTFYGILIEN